MSYQRCPIMLLCVALMVVAGCVFPTVVSIRVHELPAAVPDGSLVLLRTEAAEIIQVLQGNTLARGTDIQGVQISCTPSCEAMGLAPGSENVLRFELSDGSSPVAVHVSHPDYHPLTVTLDAPRFGRAALVLLRPRVSP